MDFILRFDAPQASDKTLVGGKGANLGLLTQAGFPVPGGFNITTDAYSVFVTKSGLSSEISSIMSGADHGDADDLEARTAKIRGLVLQTPMPDEIAASIRSAYAELGSGDDAASAGTSTSAGEFVAVRSSGTAEDLAEASFAGLHDTLLDIRGDEALLGAVRECWASLWTARATSYRQRGGFDHTEALLCVVVQRMIAADVSGVMFTGNPMNTATDELMINASWGLGEAVVQGILTPDTYVVNADDLHVREALCGTKEVRIRRDPDSAHGTLSEEVDAADRARLTLSDEQAAELARLGLRVQEYYEGFPQDIEWALEGDTFHLLQSRPITGVEFSWDGDLEYWQKYPEPDDRIWSRALADENWTGAISPLMYSWRAPSWVAGHEPAAQMWGFPEIEKTRFWKFHKATAYFNTDLERAVITQAIPKPFRPMLMANVPQVWHEDLLEAPFSWASYLKMYARVELLRPNFYKGFDILDNKWREKFSTEGRGIPRDELAKLSDRELKRYVETQIAMEDEYNYDLWTWFFVNARDMQILLASLTAKWYGTEDPMAFQALLTGTPQRTETVKINHWLWELSERIRHSEVLSTAFREHQDGAFFAECENSADGREFLASYKDFLWLYGQRGQPDRDIYFPRRREDPGIDYRALAGFLSVENSADPSIREHEVNAQREAFTEEVLEKIRRQPLGGLKAELFKIVLDYCVKFVMARDNERNFLDHATMSIREGFLEIGARLTERGVFDTEDDLWFVGRDVLYGLLLDGAPMTRLLRTKIEARRRDFERMLARENPPPPYLQNNHGVELDVYEHEEGRFKGMGTAKGTVTATARVVRQLKDVGKVKQGEILVVNATDPGWTPVFHLISGIVLETGGILAHGSCLAREYGLPAVQLANAMQLVPDGATITLSGDSGTVTLVDTEEDAT